MSIDRFLVVHEPSEDGAPEFSEDSATEDNKYSTPNLRQQRYTAVTVFFPRRPPLRTHPLGVAAQPIPFPPLPGCCATYIFFSPPYILMLARTLNEGPGACPGKFLHSRLQEIEPI